MAEFDIKMQGNTVGKALVEKQGLYYRFDCQCTFSDKEIHAIWACWEGGSRKLGVCVPYGTKYCLVTRIPIKHVPDTGLVFLVDHKEQREENFYPVDPHQPFEHIDKLPSAYYVTRDNCPGLIIPE